MLKDEFARLERENISLGKRSDAWDLQMGKMRESLKERDMKIEELNEKCRGLVEKVRGGGEGVGGLKKELRKQKDMASLFQGENSKLLKQVGKLMQGLEGKRVVSLGEGHQH